MTRDRRRAADRVAAATARGSWWLSSGAWTYSRSASVSWIARSTTSIALESAVTAQSRRPPQRRPAPRISAARFCSRPREPSRPEPVGPFSPPVITSIVTASPAAWWASSVAPQPSSMSSGCAPIASTLRMVVLLDGRVGGRRRRSSVGQPLPHPLEEDEADNTGSEQADRRTRAVARPGHLRRGRTPGRLGVDDHGRALQHPLRVRGRDAHREDTALPPRKERGRLVAVVARRRQLVLRAVRDGHADARGIGVAENGREVTGPVHGDAVHDRDDRRGGRRRHPGTGQGHGEEAQRQEHEAPGPYEPADVAHHVPALDVTGGRSARQALTGAVLGELERDSPRRVRSAHRHPPGAPRTASAIAAAAGNVSAVAHAGGSSAAVAYSPCLIRMGRAPTARAP